MPEQNIWSDNEESIDDLLLGGMKIIQARQGYRFSLDAVLLAHFANLQPRDRVIDLGTGNGVIPLIMAYRFPHNNITGLEIQPNMAERARRNVLLNNLAHRVEIINGDIRKVDKIFSAQAFEVLVSNPPFFRQGEGHINKQSEQAIARHELELSLPELIAGAAYLLRNKGRMFLIYRSERLMDLLSYLPEYNFNLKKIRFIHSLLTEPANLFLAEIEKQGRGQLTVLSPLIIYAEKGVYSSEIKSYYHAYK